MQRKTIWDTIYIHHALTIQTLTIVSFSEDVKHNELLYTADGSVTWYNHFEKSVLAIHQFHT